MTVAAIGAVIVASKLSKINTVKLDTDKLSVSKEAKKKGKRISECCIVRCGFKRQ